MLKGLISLNSMMLLFTSELLSFYPKIDRIDKAKLDVANLLTAINCHVVGARRYLIKLIRSVARLLFALIASCNTVDILMLQLYGPTTSGTTSPTEL